MLYLKKFNLDRKKNDLIEFLTVFQLKIFRFDTIVEIQREINAHKDDDECIEFVLSIGTGNQPIVKSRAADAIWPSSVLDAYKSISATVELAKVFVDTVCEADRWVVQRSRAWCEMAGIKYHRFVKSS